MRILVWDGVHHSHHPSWMPRIVEALRRRAEVIACLPQALADASGPLEVEQEILPPDAHRPAVQLDLLPEVIARHRPDHVLHLYAIKELLREWLRRPPLAAPATVVVLHPAALHYPSAYRTPLSARDRSQAVYKELLLHRWRRRQDAHAVFVGDPGAVPRLARRGGAPAYPLPEPPLGAAAPRVPAGDRHGALLYGALTRNKGIGRLARALTVEPSPLTLRIAGEADADLLPDLERWASAMRQSGVALTLSPERVAPADGLALIAAARCLAMPYVKQPGMSRTLVEAAAAGTPVVAHAYGLLGALVRERRLGVAVDCEDPRALRHALLTMAGDPDAVDRHAEALRAFAAEHEPAAFARALWAPFAD